MGDGGGQARPDRLVNVLVIDNYDSFTYNLVQYLGELGAEPDVVRNDKASVAELLERRPDRLVISPGPCTPAEAGVAIEVPYLRSSDSHSPAGGVRASGESR